VNGFGPSAEIERFRAALAADHGVTVRYDRADLSRQEPIETMMNNAISEFGAVDILVNAGISSWRRWTSFQSRSERHPGARPFCIVPHHPPSFRSTVDGLRSEGIAAIQPSALHGDKPMNARKKRRRDNGAAPKHSRDTFPGQIVLVLQGGGALGAYQAGVFEALHEAGVEPDWVIGTSIGAVNAAIIAGNTHANRLSTLKDFWSRVEQNSSNPFLNFWFSLTNMGANLATLSQGIPCFFTPHLPAWRGLHSPLGVEAAAY
jgi:hypothetical protein